MTKVANIAKNTSYFTFALILQKVISFTYFIILGRTFVPDDLGMYFLAISLTTIFAIFIDLGLSNVLTREIAKDQDKAKFYVSSVVYIKIPLAIISWISLFLFVNIFDYSDLVKQLVYLSSICMILDSFTASFFACLRGFHNLKFESIASILFQVIVFSLGLTAIKLNLSLHYLILALIAASIFNFTYSLSLLKFKLKINIFSKVNPLLVRTIIKLSVPFALFGIYQKLYMYLDTVLLSLISGEYAVGIYQVPFKIIFALQFLPMAFTASLYPAFSSYWKSNKEQLSITFERAINYLVIISLPISIGVITLADKILLLLKPEYIDSKLSLQITMAALIFMFLNFPIGSMLNACDRQKLNTRNMAIALVASIILNLILIPRFNVAGASTTVLLTNALMFVLGIILIPKITKIRFYKMSLVLLKSIFAAAIMGSFVLTFKDNINIFVLIPIAGLLYFILLFAARAFQKEDIISIYNSFLKKG